MSVENERLKLVSHVARTNAEGHIILERADGEEVELPARFQHFYRRTTEGFSPAQMARELRHSTERKRFALLLRYLIFLADHGLLADRRLIRLTELFREDYDWPESGAFGELFGFQLFKWAGGRVPPALSWMAAIGLLAIGLFFLKSFWFRMIEWGANPEATEALSSLAGVIAFLFAFCVGRSLRALAQLCSLRLVAGQEASLRLRADAVSLSFATDDISRVRGGIAYFFANAGVFCFAFAAPLLASRVFSDQSQIHWAVAQFTVLLALVDLSPFVRSPFTEWLRGLYNFADHKQESFGLRNNALETKMKLAHIVSSTTWILAFGVFLVGPAWRLILSLKEGLDLTTRNGQIGSAVLALLMLIVFASLIDDIVGSFAYSGADDQRRIRRIWKRRHPPLAVDEAIQQGKAPSRADLEKLPLLRQLDLDTRRELLANASVLDLREGESACKQDSTDRSLFILLSGRMAVAKRSGQARRRVVALLNAGSIFGEAGFFFGQKRGADVVAMENSRVLRIKHDEKMKTMDHAHSEELQLRIWFLQALVSGSFFKELPSDALDALIFAGRKHTVAAGKKIISEGERADSCYFIVQGQASVMQNMRAIGKLKAGDVFGEIGLLWPGTLRTATIVADSDVLAVCLEAERFWELIAAHLPLALEIEKLSERRLIADQSRMQNGMSAAV